MFLTHFMEVKFFFCGSVAGFQESLTIGSMYSIADEDLKNHSHGALNVFEYDEKPLVVIMVKSILSVVAMVPFKQEGESCQFFLVEKFALGIIDSEENLDGAPQ